MKKQSKKSAAVVNRSKKKKVKKISDQIKELNDDPILYNGFDNHIIGYDLETNSVIYDGDGIINQLVDENMKEDERVGELDGEWEDYYDQALEYVCEGLPQSISCTTFKNGKWIDLNEGRPLPIIMMHFIQ